MTETTSKPISRRTVAKGAAWTAPVIFGGVAAPAYAASGGAPTLTGGAACKIPGNSCPPFLKGYRFPFTIHNNSADKVWLYAPPGLDGGTSGLTLEYGGARVAGVFYDDVTNIPIEAGQEALFELSAGSTNSANLDFVFTVTFAWGHTATAAGDTDHGGDPVVAIVNVPATPPDCDVVCDDKGPNSSTLAARSSEPSSSSSSTSPAAPKPTSPPAQAPAMQPASTSTSVPAAPTTP